MNFSSKFHGLSTSAHTYDLQTSGVGYAILRGWSRQWYRNVNSKHNMDKEKGSKFSTDNFKYGRTCTICFKSVNGTLSYLQLHFRFIRHRNACNFVIRLLESINWLRQKEEEKPFFLFIYCLKSRKPTWLKQFRSVLRAIWDWLKKTGGPGWYATARVLKGSLYHGSTSTTDLPCATEERFLLFIVVFEIHEKIFTCTVFS